MPHMVGLVLDVGVVRLPSNGYIAWKQVCRFASLQGRSKSGEIAGMLKSRSVHICRKQETRFRENSIKNRV